MPEILAPAGGAEQLTAAVRCGADAVYLGASGFNARRNAENFGEEGLRNAIAFCRARNVAVHVTVNTLVTDGELPALLETAEEIASAGADAVILQDLAAARLFRERFPELKRHASTQMTVHNLDGAKLCADLGFSRVVLARELTLKEIEFITARCGIETEVFVHGALCMAMSGACTLSSLLGGRSGNRGLCAQPCRLNFRACPLDGSGEREYALSLKDMSHLKHLRELRDAGVASFKIEGRMKRPEYVAAAVTAARLALEGQDYDEKTLRAAFSRSGFTDGYLAGKRDVTMFGVRREEDAAASSEVLGTLRDLYRRERQSVPVDMTLTVSGERTALAVSDGQNRVLEEGAAPERARSRPLTTEDAKERLCKTGGTPYFVRGFGASVEEGLTVSASALNALRRDALEQLTALREQVPECVGTGWTFPEEPPHAPGKRLLRGRFQKAEQICREDAFEKLILPMEELARDPKLVERYGDRLVAELPALLFDGDAERLRGTLEALKKAGLREALCENLYGVRVAKELGFELHGGAGLNVMNTPALRELETLGLADATVSFELAMSKIAPLGGTLPRGLIAYGRLPAMRFRNCPARGKRGCGECTGEPSLRDRKNVEFPIICHEKRWGTLLNSVPLYVADKFVAPVDFLTLQFTVETREEASRVVESFLAGETPDFPRTGGLYYRTLL